MEIVLSLLICTIPKRQHLFDSLMKSLHAQVDNSVEILFDSTSDIVGKKRNNLLSRASGDYIVFIDDDDEITEHYISEILRAAGEGCDAIAIQGYMTTDGESRIPWRISKDYPYIAAKEHDQLVYLRFNNHISPIKRSIAQQFAFPEINAGEDYKWALAIHKSGLIKTEAKTNGEIYHYKFISNK